MEITMNDLTNLFKEAASAPMNAAGDVKRAEFAAALSIPILQEIKLRSVVREMFAVENIGPGGQALYPVADDFDVPVWVLPGLGYVAQNFIEGVGEDVYVPTFSISAAADWKISYAEEGRTDIMRRAINKIAQAIAEYEEECGWKVIVPAGTTNFGGSGLLGARSAPVYEVSSGSAGAGYLSKELLNKMIVGMRRTDRTLTDLYVAPEDAADIREWTDTDVDPVTRREIFQAAGMGRIWNVTLHEIPHLGPVGKFNINGNGSSYGVFTADVSSNFKNYHLDNPNVVDANREVTTAGETQVWGFDRSVNDSLVMPIKRTFEPYDDPTLLRRQKQGVFGWEEVGFGCLDSRMLSMGVIDRSL